MHKPLCQTLSKLYEEEKGEKKKEKEMIKVSEKKSELIKEVKKEEPKKEEAKKEEAKKVKSYDFVKGRIIYRLVNRERNRKLLEDVPYKEYLDLAIVYYVLLEMDEYGMASMLVRREHLKMWKVSEEDIYYRACKNTQKLLPYDFSTMRSVIMELLEIGREIEEQTGKMYILSNVMRSYGACAMMYPDLLRKIGEELEENYYILPSSVHETIIVAQDIVNFFLHGFCIRRFFGAHEVTGYHLRSVTNI